MRNSGDLVPSAVLQARLTVKALPLIVSGFGLQSEVNNATLSWFCRYGGVARLAIDAVVLTIIVA